MIPRTIAIKGEDCTMDTFQSPGPPALPPQPQPPGAREPRVLPAGAGAGFWSEAWRVFSAAPGMWILILIVYVAISVVLSLIPVVGSIAHAVLTPVFAGGVMLGCHALARGEPLTITHLFDGFTQHRFGPLAIVGLIVLAMWIVFFLVAFVGLFLSIGVSGLSALADQNDPSVAYGALGVSFIALCLVLLVLSCLIFMAYWFAPALVVLDGAEPVAALRKSFAACWGNVGAFFVYGLIFIGLAIVASIPFALGWLVLGPMIAGSCYAGWRQIWSG
jgi:uncharacterized membrane protein